MTPSAHDPHLGIVVEGAGEIESAAILFRRWRQERHADFRDLLGKPVPCHGRDKALMPDGLEGKVAIAAARPGCKSVAVVLDGEGDPVCNLGPTLQTRANSVTGKPVVVCLADDKFESWLYASAESLELGLEYDPVRDGQKAIKEALRPTKYVKPTWQPRLAYRLDFGLAVPRSLSLRRTLERFDVLVGHI